MDKAKKQMFCFICMKPLSCEKHNLEEHALKHAFKMMDAPFHILDNCVGTEKSTLHHVSQIVRIKVFWTSFILEVMSIGCKEICAPASVVDPSGQLLFLTNDVFNPRELDEMTRHASFLETNGKLTKCGVHKGGSKMVTFGISYKYGKLAWLVKF